MVGIVTFDDAMDVMEDEATEDMEIMGGMTPSDKTYLRSSTFDLFKHRIPWLMLLMVSATFTGLIITHFESALAAQVALTAFIPMLMDTGGNSGSAVLRHGYPLAVARRDRVFRSAARRVEGRSARPCSAASRWQPPALPRSCSSTGCCSANEDVTVPRCAGRVRHHGADRARVPRSSAVCCRCWPRRSASTRPSWQARSSRRSSTPCRC